MTAYRYPPFYLNKLMWQTEGNGPEALMTAWKSTLDSSNVSVAVAFQQAADKADDWSARKIPITELKKQAPYAGNEKILRIPEYVRCNQERYEVWFGKVDQ